MTRSHDNQVRVYLSSSVFVESWQIVAEEG